MTTPQVEMLRDCVSILEERYPKPEWAFVALVEWAGSHFSFIQEKQVYLPTPTMTEAIHNRLLETFNVKLLQADCWDWWGETALALELEGWVGQWPDRAKIEAAAEQFATSITSPTHTFYDRNADTGRLLLAVWSRCRTGIMLGQSRTRNPYHLCLLNMACQEVTSHIYKGNQSLHDLANPLWELSNLWGGAAGFKHGRPISHNYNRLAMMKRVAARKAAKT